MAENTNDNNNNFNSLRETIEELEKKLLSSQIDNSNKASEIKKYRDELSKYHSTTHDTSSQFPLTSAFIQQWDNFALGTIMDTFEKIYDNSELIAYLVKAIFIQVKNACSNIINEKIKALISYLGIRETITSEMINFVYMKFKVIIFQDYFTTLFALDDCVINSIVSNTQKQIKSYITSIPNGLFNNMNSVRERSDDMLHDLNSNEMRRFIKEAFDLNMFMLLHEPKLFVDFNDELSYLFFDKNEHINIEGFTRDNSSCVLILPPPLLKKGFRFQGIKSAVYICLNPSDYVLNECNSKGSNANSNKKLCKSLVHSLGSFDFSVNNKESEMNNCNDELNNSSMIKERSLMKERKKRNKQLDKGYCNKLSSFERSIPKSPKKCILYKTKSASIKKTRRSFNCDSINYNINNHHCFRKPSLSSTLTLMKALDDSKNNNNSMSLSRQKNRNKHSFNKDEFLSSISSKIIHKSILLKKCNSNTNGKLKYESKQISQKKTQANTNSNNYCHEHNHNHNNNPSPDDSKVNCQFRTKLLFGNNNHNVTLKKAFFEESNSRNDNPQMINHFRYNTNLLLTNSSFKKKKSIMNRDSSNKSIVKKLEKNENSFQKLLINLHLHNGKGIPKNSKTKNALVSYSSRRINSNNSQRLLNVKKDQGKHKSPPVYSLDLNKHNVKGRNNNNVIVTKVKLSNENENDMNNNNNENY